MSNFFSRIYKHKNRNVRDSRDKLFEIENENRIEIEN